MKTPHFQQKWRELFISLFIFNFSLSTELKHLVGMIILLVSLGIFLFERIFPYTLSVALKVSLDGNSMLSIFLHETFFLLFHI